MRYGLEDDAELSAVDLKLESATARFTPRWRGGALGALGSGLALGAPAADLARGLASFRGVERRFQLVGEARGVKILDDYAHHPSELAANLETARRALRRPITAVFQPHLFSRTQQLMAEFAAGFSLADRVVITDIYPAREAPIPGVTGEALAAAIRAREPQKEVRFVSPKEAIVPLLMELLRPGDVVLTFGAGDIRQVGEALVAALQRRQG